MSSKKIFTTHERMAFEKICRIYDMQPTEQFYKDMASSEVWVPVFASGRSPLASHEPFPGSTDSVLGGSASAAVPAAQPIYFSWQYGPGPGAEEEILEIPANYHLNRLGDSRDVKIMKMLFRLLAISLYGFENDPHTEIARLTKLAKQWEDGYRQNWQLAQKYQEEKTLAQVALDKCERALKVASRSIEKYIADGERDDEQRTRIRSERNDAIIQRDGALIQLKAAEDRMLEYQKECERLQKKANVQWETIKGYTNQVADLKARFADCVERNTRILSNDPGEMQKVIQQRDEYRNQNDDFAKAYRTMEIDRDLWKDQHGKLQELLNIREQAIRISDKVLNDCILELKNEKKAHTELRVETTDQIDRLKKATASLTFTRICEFGQRWWPSSPDSNFETAFFNWYQEKYPTEQ